MVDLVEVWRLLAGQHCVKPLDLLVLELGIVRDQRGASPVSFAAGLGLMPGGEQRLLLRGGKAN
jgi:hypothetical protein